MTVAEAAQIAYPRGMRFLQLVMSTTKPAGPPSAEHIAKTRADIQERIASGVLLATGGLGRRATAAARITRKDGEVVVEDPPSGDGWMAAGGYSLSEYTTKEDAVANAKKTLEMMGDGVVELIQVSEMFPPARRPGLPSGVVPYLTIDGASDAIAFYVKAFGAKEVSRLTAPDGARVAHCHLEINGGALMLADDFEKTASPSPRSGIVMQLVVADGQAWWKRAIDAGCKEKLPFVRAHWGDDYGQLVDPFGVTWALSSPAS